METRRRVSARQGSRAQSAWMDAGGKGKSGAGACGTTRNGGTNRISGRRRGQQNYGVHSMSEMSEINLMKIYHGWTGKGLRRRARLPKRGEAAARPGEIQMASGEELVGLDSEFAKRELGEEGRENFIRRQLGGRLTVRTRRDFVKVLGGLRAMNRRDGLTGKGEVTCR